MNSTEINAAITEADELTDGKVIHYLGWYWRDVDWDGYIRVSFHEGHAWIDEAGKWDYHSRLLNPEETAQLRKLVETLAKTFSLRDAHAINLFLEALEECPCSIGSTTCSTGSSG